VVGTIDGLQRDGLRTIADRLRGRIDRAEDELQATESQPPASSLAEPPPPPPPPPTLREPTHIEVPEAPVAEFADPGAEDGPHADIEIDEPWPGYRRLRAQDVIDRITATEEEEILAMVSLYERAHRSRSSVVEAADRRLSQVSG
jgi:hypothetical protein